MNALIPTISCGATGVSQTTVREAMACLESDGLVAKESPRSHGATSPLHRKQLDDLYQLSYLIEPWGGERMRLRNFANAFRARWPGSRHRSRGRGRRAGREGASAQGLPRARGPRAVATDVGTDQTGVDYAATRRR